MRAVANILAAAAVLACSACAPPACQDGPDRRLAHDVDLLVRDDGPLGQAAHQRLVRHGPEAVAVIETGLYFAEPPARLRLVRALKEIRHPEAAPVLRHLAERDPDAEVRDAAAAALATLPSP